MVRARGNQDLVGRRLETAILGQLVGEELPKLRVAQRTAIEVVGGVAKREVVRNRVRAVGLGERAEKSGRRSNRRRVLASGRAGRRCGALPGSSPARCLPSLASADGTSGVLARAMTKPITVPTRIPTRPMRDRAMRVMMPLRWF